MSDLTSISTFGWYDDVAAVDQLKPISTFGWYFDLVTTGAGDELVTFMLCLQRVIERDLEI